MASTQCEVPMSMCVSTHLSFTHPSTCISSYFFFVKILFIFFKWQSYRKRERKNLPYVSYFFHGYNDQICLRLKGRSSERNPPSQIPTHVAEAQIPKAIFVAFSESWTWGSASSPKLSSQHVRGTRVDPTCCTMIKGPCLLFLSCFPSCTVYLFVYTFMIHRHYKLIWANYWSFRFFCLILDLTM